MATSAATSTPRADRAFFCPTIIAARKNERSIAACAADLRKWERVLQAYAARRRIRVDTGVQSEEACLAYLRAELHEDPVFTSQMQA